MLKSITTLLAILFTLNSFAQITFDQGYFINDKDEKIDCWIKNVDWRNNPNKFQYKLSENAESQTATIESVKEFGINNFSKYQRVTVEIDRSSKELPDMSTSRDPNFKKEQLFLKILVEGSAILFFYQEKNLKRYFIKTVDTEIEQLVYKKYKTFEKQVKENRQYLVQLRDQLKCKSTTTKKLKKLEYQKKPLVKMFEEYNQCVNVPFINYEKLNKRDLFNLSIRPGVQLNSLNMNLGGKDIEFDKSLGFRIGLELEFILPFNQNKWSVFAEPTFQNSKTTAEVSSIIINSQTNTVTSVYNSIELPMGFKYYLFLNPNSKIFLNGAYLLDLSLPSKISFESGADYKYGGGNNLTNGWVLGIGYNYKSKYHLEVRYGFNRDPLADSNYANVDYKPLSLIFGYSFF